MWALTFTACLLATVYADSPDFKPGHCPTDLALLGSQPCVKDSGCSGAEKCCSNLCAQPECDDDDIPAQCPVDPCADAQCSKVPGAVCITETCEGDCERFWFTGDGDVTDICEDDENDDPMTRKQKKEARKAKKEARKAKKEARKMKKAGKLSKKEDKVDKKEKKSARLAKKEERLERKQEKKATKLAKKAARKDRKAGGDDMKAAKKAKKLEKADKKAARQAKRQERQEKKAAKMEKKQAKLDKVNARLNKI